MKHDGLFEPETDPNQKRTRKKVSNKNKVSAKGLGDQISGKVKVTRGGDLMARFVSASADIQAPEFNKVELMSGRAAKQEEKGLVVPKVDYVSDEVTNGEA